MNVKEFIEQNIALIDANDFKALYQKAEDELFFGCGKITDTLISAGIDPLEYMDMVPQFYGSYGQQETYIIPDSVDKIIKDAFFSSDLKYIHIPKMCTRIMSCAFEECTNLTSVKIDEGIVYIGEKAFSGCESLRSITLPNSLETLGSGVFKACNSLGDITIPPSIKFLREDTFFDAHIDKLTLPNTLTYIYKNAFKRCTIDELVFDAPSNLQIESGNEVLEVLL